MRIIVAYDGSECAQAALNDMRRAGFAADVEARVVSVAELWFPLPPPSSYEIIDAALMPGQSGQVTETEDQNHPQEYKGLEKARAQAAEAQGQLEKYFPGWKVSSEACTGSAA